MAKEHKYHRSRIEIDTSLPPARVLELAKQTIEAQRNVQLIAEDESQLLAVVKSIVGMKILHFTVTARAEGERTTVHTTIERYTTSQQTVLVFIPVGPKSMEGYSAYRTYMNSLQQVITAADPSARCTITERELVA